MRRSSLDKGSVTAGLTNEAYDDVKKVADNLEAILQVSDNLTTLSSFDVIVTPDGGDGSVNGDMDAMDFTGHSHADDVVQTAVKVEITEALIVIHKGIIYNYTGITPVLLGIGGTPTLVSDYSVLGAAGASDHDTLTNRDIADQHPITSITNLVTELDSKELDLGNPGVDGYILSSTVAGVRSWIPFVDPVWGNITGTLSNQTDLQNALDAKSDATHNHDAAYSALGHTHVIADITDYTSPLGDFVATSTVGEDNLNSTKDLLTLSVADINGLTIETAAGGPPPGLAPVLANSEDVSLQGSSPSSVQFSDNGLIMYVLSFDDQTVYQHTLSIAWDTSSATYASKSLAVGGQELSPQALFIGNNGTRLYIAGADNHISQWNMSGGDLSTASYIGDGTHAGSGSTVGGMWFASDGSAVYEAYEVGYVYRHSLGTPWLISSIAIDGTWEDFTADSTDISGIDFSDDGLKMFLVGNDGEDIFQYTLGTAFDETDATLAYTFNVTTQDGFPTDVQFGDSGNKMYVSGSFSDSIHEYDCSPAFNIGVFAGGGAAETVTSLLHDGLVKVATTADGIDVTGKVTSTLGIDKLTTGSGTGAVDVSASAAPTADQVLVALTPTTAEWQDIPTPAPAGADTQLQYNDGGTTVAGAASATYNNIDGRISLAVGMRNANGAAATPSYAFTSDPDSGLYYEAARLALGFGGASRLDMNATEVNSRVPFHTTLGGASDPGYNFNGIAGMGMYYHGANQLGFSTGNTARVVISNTGLDIPQASNTITVGGGVDKLTTATGAVDITGGSNPALGHVLTATGPNAATWQAPSGGGGLAAVVDDLAPQLGGDLDVNNNSIVGSPAATATSSGGHVYITGASGGATSGNGGDINLKGGAALGASLSGNVIIEGGAGTTSPTAAGNAILKGGIGGNNTDGGDITLTAGSTPRLGNADGGHIHITPGGQTTSGAGARATGTINIHGGVNRTEQGAIRFWNDTNTDHTTGNYIELVAAATTANRVWVLPDDDPAVVSGQFLTTDASGNLSFGVPAGSGDVSKVGTPVDNQIAVWTGDGTIEGVAQFTFNANTLTVQGQASIYAANSGLNTLSVTNQSPDVGSNGIYAATLGVTAYAIHGTANKADSWGVFAENTNLTDAEVFLAGGSDLIVGSVDGVEQFKVTDTGVVTGLSFNGVALTTGGLATNFLNAEGNYVSAGGGGGIDWGAFNNGAAPTTAPIAFSTRSISIGDGATSHPSTVAETDSIAIGTNANANRAFNIAIGNNCGPYSGTSNGSSIVIGSSAKVFGSGDVVVGTGAESRAGGGQTVYGYNSIANVGSTASTIVGTASTTNKSTQVCVGKAVTHNSVTTDVAYSAKIGYGAAVADRNLLHLHSKGKLELVGNEAQYVIPSYTTAGIPATTTLGGLVYDTDLNLLKIYDGAWNIVDGSGWETYEAVTYAATLAIDFDDSATQYIAATGALSTLTTANRVAGKKMDVIVLASAADRDVTLNASWHSFGEASPITVPSGKRLIMSFTATGTAETDINVSCVLEN